MRLADALVYLRPGAAWTCPDGSYGSLSWQDAEQTKPSQSEVTAALALLTCWAARRAAYPPLGNGLDALVHKENGDATHWQAYVAACNAVKTANPKP